MSPCLRKTVLLLTAVLPLAATALERIELLPTEAKTYIRVSNTTGFWAELKKSSIGKLWADRQFQDFIGNPDAETWQEIFFKGEPDAEDKIMLEQLKMLKGEVILAFDPDAEDPYIIAAMGKADFERSLDLDEKLVEGGNETFTIVKSAYQGVEIVQHIEEAGTPEEESTWQAHVGDTLIFGHTREWVERGITMLKKEEIKPLSGRPFLDINIPVSSLLLKSIDKGEAGNEQRKTMEAMGLLGIERFTAHIELQTDHMLVDNDLAITDLQRGLFSILDTQPSSLPAVTFIPDNIASLEVGRFDLLGLWQEIPVFLSSAQPQMKPQFDMMLGMIQQQTSINLEQDLLTHLGKAYVSFTTVEGGKQISVVAIELQDGPLFRQGLERAMAAPAIQPYVAAGLEIADFLDHTIYTMKNAPPEESVGVALIDSHLLYGTPEGLRQVIRSVTSDAAANTDFERSELVQGLREYISPRAFGFSAVDWKRNMDAIIGELTKPEIVSTINQQWARSGVALPPPDFNKLPPADHIASFFNVSYQYVEEKGGGLHQRIILKY